MNTENLNEKVSVNINTSTLSQIDLLVDNGYYSNRSDFINQSLRDTLRQQQSTLDRIIDRQHSKPALSKEPWFIGVSGYTAADIKEMYEQGGGFTITGYGMLCIDSDVDEEMLFAAVQKISIKGKASCSRSVKEHYGLK